MIYVYTPRCCERTLNPTIKTVEAQGYVFEYVDAEVLDSREEGLLKCYLPPGYINVPQLICPASGNRKIISERSVLDQVLSFAKECREYAGCGVVFFWCP